MQIKRRDFLRLVGGVSGAALLGIVSLDDVIEVPEELVEAVRNGPGIESWKNTICRLCSGGCGISVRLVDGVPVSLKGNRQYPVNQGGLCPMGFAGLQVLYHPERLKGPVRRIGLHGRGTWEPVSWEDAHSEVVDTLSELRTTGRSHQIAFLGSDESDVLSDHFARFMRAFGSPNYYRFSSQSNDTVPFFLTQGQLRQPAYDLLNTRFVLSLGSNFLEEDHSPIYYTKLYSSLRDQIALTRTQFICVDSRMTLTAANADQWIPIKPGTYGALALGLAFVLIREEMIDAEFVREQTFGYEDSVDSNGRTRMGFKSLVLAGYYPERVAEITGVPAETILEIGRSLGNTLPSVVLFGSAVTNATGGAFAAAAAHSLNALLGNIETDGGVVLADPPPLADLPDVGLDETALSGLEQPPLAQGHLRFPLSEFAIQSFTENLLNGEPYPIEVLFIYGGNPLFRVVNHHQLSEALKRVPLIISFSSFIDETSEYADLILPDHSFLEKWDAVSNTRSVIFSHVGVQQPVVEPFHDTRSTADVLTSVAQGVGGAVGEAMAIESFEDVLGHRFRGVFDSGRGAVITEGVQRSWLEFLQQRGWQIGRYSSFPQFWQLIVENGGWWDPVRRTKARADIYKTSSGRFEFFSQTLERSILDRVGASAEAGTGYDLERVLTELGISSRGDTVFLPHHEPPSIPADGLPLYLTVFQTLANRDGHAANLPMMQEMFGQAVRRYWRTWAEMHPDTAAAFGVEDGDWIWIESDVGNIRVQAVVHIGIAPNVVSVPFGLGHTSYGKYAAGYGVNPCTIIRAEYDGISGMPALNSTRVRITRVT